MPVYTKLFAAFFFGVFFTYYALMRIFNRRKHLQTRLANTFLLFASLVFYAWAGVRMVPVLLVFGIITYISGLVLLKAKTGRKLLVVAFVIVELLPVCIYRVLGFVRSLPWESAPVGSSDAFLQFIPPAVPLGLSFFSLQIVTYTISVYKGRLEPERNPVNILLFTCFFPCISSGPIQRAEKLLPQIKEKKEFDYINSSDGLKLMAFGFMKKLVLADSLAVYIQAVRSSERPYGTALFLTAVLYSFHLYLDFSGYTDIVTGCAKALGFDLGKNFDHPYLSRSVGEFWRRWHISLSSWLRDYIYIPLGGSRTAKWKIYRNILITFALSGIWHGAGITWIIWGLFHGLWICIERLLGIDVRSRNGNDISGDFGHRLYDSVRILITFVIVSFGWIIFSSGSMRDVGEIIAAFTRIPGEITAIPLTELLMIPGGFNIALCMLGLLIFCLISIMTYKTSGLEIIRQKPAAI